MCIRDRLSTVRGNQRVTSDNPEATYDTLEKYGEDLVEKARNQKLDPVIGRDAEIRNVVRILSRKSKNNPVLILSLIHIYMGAGMKYQHAAAHGGGPFQLQRQKIHSQGIGIGIYRVGQIDNIGRMHYKILDPVLFHIIFCSIYIQFADRLPLCICLLYTSRCV